MSNYRFLNSYVFLRRGDCFPLAPTLTMRSTILASLLSVATAVYGYADPMGCNGVCTNAHDPALIRRDDGTYYRFSTGGKIAMHSAPSIVGPWTYKGAVLPKGSSINLNGKDDLWVRTNKSLEVSELKKHKTGA